MCRMSLRSRRWPRQTRPGQYRPNALRRTLSEPCRRGAAGANAQRREWRGGWVKTPAAPSLSRRRRHRPARSIDLAGFGHTAAEQSGETLHRQGRCRSTVTHMEAGASFRRRAGRTDAQTRAPTPAPRASSSPRQQPDRPRAADAATASSTPPRRPRRQRKRLRVPPAWASPESSLAFHSSDTCAQATTPAGRAPDRNLLADYARPPDFGLSKVPVQRAAPQRQAQIFFRAAVWRSSRVMP